MKDAVKEFTLSNGLRVILSVDTNVRSVRAQVMVNVGSIDESEETNGISHYLEHVLLTDVYSELLDEVEEIGGDRNGATFNDMTEYHVLMPNDCLETALNFLSIAIVSPKFTMNTIKGQLKAVNQEIGDTLKDPQRLLNESLTKLSFANHPIAHTVEGTAATLSNITREKLIKHYNKYYQPKNAILLLHGNFDQAEGLNLIIKYFRKWSGKESDKDERIEATFSPSLYLEKTENKHVNIVFCWKGLQRGTKYDTAYEFIHSLLNEKLNKVIRFQKEYAYRVFTNRYLYEATGKYIIRFGTQKHNVLDTLNIVRDVIRQGFSEVEVAKKKKRDIGKIKIIEERRNLEAIDYARCKLYGVQYQTTEQFLQELNKISMEDIQHVMTEVFSSKFSLGLTGDIDTELEREINNFYQKETAD